MLDETTKAETEMKCGDLISRFMVSTFDPQQTDNIHSL